MQPEPLEIGDTIALVAPASWCEGFEETAEVLRERGFRVRMPSNLEERFAYFAGTDQQRADAFMEAWKDPEVKAVWCIRGGYGSGRILDLLDYEYIREHPKIFIGMSDITALHTALLQKTGLVTFLGPVASWASDALDVWEIIQQGKVGTYENAFPFQTIVGGRGEGVLVGGNLALISAHVGTEWQLETKGKLLILEDVGEKVYRLDRMLNQLKQARMLDDLAGLILASWDSCEVGEEGWTAEQVCRDYFSNAHYPVVFGFPSGHIENQVTLPLNCRYALNGETGELTLLEPGVAYRAHPQVQSQSPLQES
ncbi:MAG: LD-carboxypeptidase [Chlamydiia bacterium]|nr:LD-carboxypeptidase [Chlamydiia bacterium]